MSRAVYLPTGTWYDWWTNVTHEGGQTVTRAVDLATMPIFVRAGAIIPLDPVRQYTSQAVGEPTTLRVYRGADGQYTLYDDDGISQDYLNGEGTWTRLTWNERSARLTIEPGPPAGAKNLPARRRFTVELIPGGTTRTVQYSGRRVDVRF
jgi:alpha-glucosidase